MPRVRPSAARGASALASGRGAGARATTLFVHQPSPQSDDRELPAGAHFLGVSKKRADGTFLVTMSLLGKLHRLGAWLSVRDAAIAFDRGSLWLGRDGALNFPEESRALGPCAPEELRRIALAQRKKARGCSSQHRGVSWNERRKLWFAVANVNKASMRGFYETELEAARAYDTFLRARGGDLRRLNFPETQAPLPTPASELRERAEAERKTERTSRFHGVSIRQDGRWHAEIAHEGVKHPLGNWAEEMDAAEAFDRAALYFRGLEARRNFPTRKLAPASPEDLREEARVRAKQTRTSQYWGVTRIRVLTYEMWRAEIVKDGNRRGIGVYDDELEAAIAYDRVARSWFGDAARLNFPDEDWPAATLSEIRAEKRSKFKETTTSRYHGVSWSEARAGWLAGIKVDKVYYSIGLFDDEEDAARAYDKKRYELRGVGPYNFPDEVISAKRPRPRR